MKGPFSKTWIRTHARELCAEFDEYNPSRLYKYGIRLRSCKAKYCEDSLISYTTLVALRKRIKDENGHVVDAVIAKDTYSNTTVKHIYTFAREVGADCIIFLSSSKGPYSVSL